MTLASGIFLVAISALGQFCLPWLCKERKQSVEHRSLPSSDVKVTVHDFLDATKVCNLSFSFSFIILCIYI